MKKILLATLATSALISSANAAVFNRPASVTIVEPLTLSAGTNLAFGKVQKVAAGSQTVIVTSAGVASGTATRVGGTTTGASYTLTGDTANLVDISITDAANVPGLTLSTFTATYGAGAGSTFTNSSTGRPAPAAGTALSFGATLTVASTVASGASYAPQYNITVTYQ